MTDKKIMIVEDDADDAAHLEERLKNLGYTVCAAVSCERQAIEKAADTHPDLALVNLRLKGEITGPEVAGQIGSRFDIPVLYLTDEAGGDLLQRAQATNPFGYVLKPFEERQLHLNILTALAMRERERRHRERETRLKRIINKYKEFTRLMKTVFNSMSEGVIVFDENGVPLYNNLSAQRIGGDHPLDKDIYKWIKKYGIYHPDRKTLYTVKESPLMLVLDGKATDNVELFIRNALKPKGIYISVSGRPLRGRAGVSNGAVLVFRDITERVLAKEALERAFAQGRMEIVDTILHNIGNAINSVTTGIETVRRTLANNRNGSRLNVLAETIRAHRENWIDYIEKDPQGQKVMPFIIALAEDFARQNEEQIKTVTRVKDRANRIADIIRTQKAFDNSTMDRKDIDLQDALSSPFRILRESLNNRGIQTSIDCENAPQEIRIQESQFHQMLINLIKNSIEAIDDLVVAQGLAETPHIRIKANTRDDFFTLKVIDNGIGIKNKDTRAVFSPGYTTKKSGTGLGLHSAANFVIACGGKIQALSGGTGKGTTMRVMLPLSLVATRVPVSDS